MAKSTTCQHDRVQEIMDGDDFESRLLALRDEANRAGDDLQANICNSALRGDIDHARACAIIMSDVESQS